MDSVKGITKEQSAWTVVTGGAGFIGRNVVAELNRRGEKRILVVDDLGLDERWKNLRGLAFEEVWGIDDFRARLARVTQAFLETAAAWDDGEEMERCLDELDGRHRRRAQAPWPTAFREPPLPETETIRAIRTKEELTAEGAAMHHCVGGYGWRVLEGDVYFYRMSEPERATICITPRAGWWVLEEVRGVCNQSVRESTLAAIEAWLAAGR